MRALVRGKRVAIVGRAGSIVGTGNGPAIDSADVVIRINWLLPTPERHIPDMGVRTDLVFTCVSCKTARNLAAREGVASMKGSGKARKRVTKRWFPKNRDPSVLATTGFVCADEVVMAGAAGVWLYGFDLFRSDHVQERAPDGNSLEGRKDGKWRHDANVEKKAWKRFLKKNRKVKPDPIFRSALK
jgi:hypothetical protein